MLIRFAYGFLGSSRFVIYVFKNAWILVNPGESHPEQRGHGSSPERRGERCEDRKGFLRWGKSLSFEGTYQCPCLTSFVSLKKIGRTPVVYSD